MKRFKISTELRIELGLVPGNGTGVLKSDTFFYVDAENASEAMKLAERAESSAKVSFGVNHVSPIGSVYQIPKHPEFYFMGIRFYANEVKSVMIYDNDWPQVSIYTERDSFNIGFSHRPEKEQRKIVEDLRKTLNI